GGAERLLGRGDMLYLPVDAGKPERIQGTFLADDELERIVEHWRQMLPGHTRPGQTWEPVTDEDDDHPEDDLLPQAEQVVREAGKASITLLQRRLGVGYARAGRLIDLLEAHGIIGPEVGGGRPREILSPELDMQVGARRLSPALSPRGPTASGAGAGASAGRSDTMLSGNPRGNIAPANSVTQAPRLPASGSHTPGHAQTQPDKRNSGITHARDTDEDVEELEW
ncbi:MAG TPA: DNA translocase FtsK, partial [Ktedonobacterales bacterium]